MACIFCQIAAGEVPSKLVYQDDEIIAFRDLYPQAPVHILVVPRKHIAALTEVKPAELPLIARMVGVANELARTEGLAAKGFRIAVNCGPEGGQSVGHLHMHLLGGRPLSGKLG